MEQNSNISTQERINCNQSAEYEIDLTTLAKTIWSGRKIILISMLICSIIGFLVAITSPDEYETTTIMLPSGGSSGSNISGLAALAGINVNTPSSGELSPIVYPQILTSLPYQLELMKTPLNFSGHAEPIPLIDYFTEIRKPNLLRKYTIGLPGVILGIPGAIISAVRGGSKKNLEIPDSQNPVELTGKQQSGRGILSGLISLNVNANGGTLTLTAKMPEALASAQLCQRAQELLQEHIIEFKIKKAKANLDYIQQRFDETKQKFEQSQLRYAAFSDRNKNITLATANTEGVKLTGQYNLIFSLYSDLARQLEQAKIQVKQDTPVFTIIEPVSVPASRSKPNRPQILLIWIFLGAVLGTGIVFGKKFIEPLIRRWKEEQMS